MYGVSIEQPEGEKLRVTADYHVAAIVAVALSHSPDLASKEINNDQFSFVGSEVGPKISIYVPHSLVSTLDELIRKGKGSFSYRAQARAANGRARIASLTIAHFGPGKGLPVKRVAKPWLSIELDPLTLSSRASRDTLLEHSALCVGVQGCLVYWAEVRAASQPKPRSHDLHGLRV